ncbi:MAG: endonuclease [Candidatus Aenigmarchaeota archaeon]|nr:endonuclease [Candidatus Aenigmarchaeota archaeon]
MHRLLLRVFNRLLEDFGEQHWWPTISKNKRLEIIIAAILTQNTSWKQVEKAIRKLHERGLLNEKKLREIPEDELANLIRCTGYYKQKARKIKEFLKFKEQITRENLLSIWGIGKETADSILLYAYNKPVFVVDAYTKRIFERLGFGKMNYDELQKLFHDNLPKGVKLFKEYHALLVELGKNYCKKRNPLCGKCPLKDICKYRTK